MKHYCAAFAVAIALVAPLPEAAAQKFVPAEVSVSREKVNIDGNICYAHHVKAKQTLYSICKAYGADINAVKELNAGTLAGGLKSGSILYIPAGGAAVEYPREIGQGNCTDATAEQSATESATSGGDVKYIRHRVKWYDSLLMLSLKYKVSQEDIVTINNLDSKTLVVGDVLKIPIGETPIEDFDANEMIAGLDADDASDSSADFFTEDSSRTYVLADSIPDHHGSGFDFGGDNTLHPASVPFDGVADVALLLPLAARSGAPSQGFLDFYAGVLIALDEMRADGSDINLKVMDMADWDSAEEMLSALDGVDYDFVVGNFPAESIETAASWCDARRIPLISPLDQKVEEATYSHPCLVNVPVSATTQAKRLVESIYYTPGRDNVVVVCEDTQTYNQFHSDVIASLDSLGIPYTVEKSALTRSTTSGIGRVLSASRHNHVIVTIEKESAAADAIRNLALATRGGSYEVTGYASQKVRKFESIDRESFESLSEHFSLGYYVDYKDENVRSFVRKYRALTNAEPGNFAFQGYDIARYFVSALKQYGSDMINGIASYSGEGLQLNFRFARRSEQGGMFNEATKQIAY